MRDKLVKITQQIRHYILKSSFAAGSGHPTSSLSAVELMTVLFFDGFFQADFADYHNPQNDKLIFSKGHASPLFYAIFAVLGQTRQEDLLAFRKFGSITEGHPTMKYPFTIAPTGSLGQGLGVGCGIAKAAKIDKIENKTWVLLGDSEIAEGSVWEAMDFGANNQLNNLVAILDANRLGQNGETMHGHNLKKYADKAQAFGWETSVIDGHNLAEIQTTFNNIKNDTGNKPHFVVAKTFKGKGVSFLENELNWHGKVMNEVLYKKAVAEIGYENI